MGTSVVVITKIYCSTCFISAKAMPKLCKGGFVILIVCNNQKKQGTKFDQQSTCTKHCSWKELTVTSCQGEA